MTDYSHAHPLVPPESVARWLADVPQPIAVTGGTGFVGSHLVDTLCAAGLSPKVLARDPRSPRWIGTAPVTWVSGSLEEGGALKRLVDGAKTVFHLAGVVRAAGATDFDLGNRVGTSNLVAAMREAAPDARLVHVSSLAAVGPSDEPAGVGPEAEPEPISSYGRSKLRAEHVVREAGHLWWSIVRPPAIYGPRDTDVLEFFRMASRGVVAIPAGDRWVTVAWAGDVVRSLVAAAVGPPGTVYHVGEPDPIAMETLVRELCRAGGVACRIIRIPAFLVRGAGAFGSALHRIGWRRLSLTADKSRELLARHWTARTEDSMRDLGIDQQTRFADGAARTWAWYRHRGWLR